VLIENRQVIDAPRAELWEFLMQVDRVGECVPGITDIRAVAPEEYEGTMKLKVGPISLKFDARLHVVERSREHWTLKLQADAAERGVGGNVTALFTMTLGEVDRASTELTVQTDAKILGKLGEFGQPVMRKKAATITEQFARTIGERVGRMHPVPVARAADGAPPS
jgi:carbon monoxide dehydrogenase subunit G